MAEVKEDRRNFIERLLGKKGADELKATMESAQQILDKAGVERKEYDSKKLKGILEDTVAAINEALSPLSDSLPEGLAQEILAIVMGKLANVDMPAEPVAEEMPEEEPMPEAVMELSRQVKALAGESTQATKDMQEFVKEFVPALKLIQQLVPAVVKEAGDVAALKERIAALEGQIKGRPRIASLTAETTGVLSEELAKMAKTEISKSAEGTKTVLGLPVKE